MKKMKNLSKKAVMSALALSVGAAASSYAVDNASPLFSLKEIGSQSNFIAQAGGTQGNCGVAGLKQKLGLPKDKSLKTQDSGGKGSDGKCGPGPKQPLRKSKKTEREADRK